MDIWLHFTLATVFITVFGLTLAHFSDRKERRAMRGRARPRGTSMIV